MSPAPHATAAPHWTARLILTAALLFGLVYGWLTLDFLQLALGLALEGREVTGTVTALEAGQITLHYRVDVTIYERLFRTDAPLIIGDTAPVTYLPEDPAIATLSVGPLIRTALATLAATLLSLMAGLIGLWRLSRR